MGCARVHHHRAVSHRLNPQAHHFLLLQEGVPLRAMQFYDAQGLLRGNLSRLETVVGLSVAEGSPGSARSSLGRAAGTMASCSPSRLRSGHCCNINSLTLTTC